MKSELAELPNTRQNNQALGKIAKALKKSPNTWQNHHIEGKITKKLAKLPSTNFFFYFDFFILINSNIGSSCSWCCRRGNVYRCKLAYVQHCKPFLFYETIWVDVSCSDHGNIHILQGWLHVCTPSWLHNGSFV